VEALDINKNRADDIVVVTLKSGVGIEDFNIISGIKIYPNPSTGKFIITTATSLQADGYILDLSGKELLRFKLNNGQTAVNADFLSDGCYIIKIVEAGGNSNVFKLMINKSH
jgi:hypothetical protein